MLSFKHVFFFSLVIGFSMFLPSSASSLTFLFLCVVEKIAVSLLCAIWFERVKSFWTAEAVGCHPCVTWLCSGTYQVTVQPLRSAAQLLMYWWLFFLHLFRQSQDADLQINKNVVVRKWIVLAKYCIACCGELCYLARISAYSLHLSWF